MNSLVYYPQYVCLLTDIASMAQHMGYTATFYDKKLTIRFTDPLSNHPLSDIYNTSNSEIEVWQLELLSQRSLAPMGHLLIEYHPPILEKVVTLLQHLMTTYKGLVYSEYKADELYDVTELGKIIELRDL